MRTVLLASLRVHTRRYLAAGLAVAIGVAFLVLVNPLASAAKAGLLEGIDRPYRNADLVVSRVDGTATAQRVLDLAAARGDRVGVQAYTYQTLFEGNRLLSDRDLIAAFDLDPAMQWQRLDAGRAPAADGEALLDANAAKRFGVGLGDVISIDRKREVRVVGLAAPEGTAMGGALYVTWNQLSHWPNTLHVDSIAYAATGSVDSARTALTNLLDASGTVTPTAQFLDERATELTRGVDVMSIMLMLFVVIALVVACLVIANTFSVMLAQRSRDFALLRCVGAGGAQVRRSVRLEALALGLIASVAGTVGGAAAGWALVAVVRSIWPKALGAPSFSPLWMLAALATGVLVTVIAAYLPIRRSTQVSPLSALRPAQTQDAVRAGRLRLGLGIGLVLLGAAGMAVSVAEQLVPAMLAGGVATFLGVIVLGPFVVPWTIRRMGALARPVFGPAGSIAVGNAVRNPRRTATTTASLLIGVTLTTAMLTGLASSRAAMDVEMDTSHPIDFTLSAEAPLPAATVQAVRGTPGVASVAVLDGVRAEVAGRSITVLAPAQSGADLDGVLHGAPAFARPADQVVNLPAEVLDENPEPVTDVVLRTGTGAAPLRVATGMGWGGTALVSPTTLATLTDRPEPMALWVRAADGADATALQGVLVQFAGNASASLTSGLVDRNWVDQQVDILTVTVVALLGVAVLIALLGIGSTLSLSVLERGRENALLRALGLSRRQLRRTLSVEAVLLSLAATVIGTALGVLFAWVGVETMVQKVVASATVQIPYLQLLAVLVVCVVAGLLACVVPARRASRIAPAAGLVLD